MASCVRRADRHVPRAAAGRSDCEATARAPRCAAHRDASAALRGRPSHVPGRGRVYGAGLLELRHAPVQERRAHQSSRLDRHSGGVARRLNHK